MNFIDFLKWLCEDSLRMFFGLIAGLMILIFLESVIETIGETIQSFGRK